MYTKLPAPNQAFAEYLAKLRKDPNLIDPTKCSYIGCKGTSSPACAIMIYRPDIEGYPVIYMQACSPDHRESLIEHYKLHPYLPWLF
jgi:hypothetical protein